MLQDLRYADDFAILATDRTWLEELIPKVADFLSENLQLEIHLAVSCGTEMLPNYRCY